MLLALICGPVATSRAWAGSEEVCFQISRMALGMARDRDDGVPYSVEKAQFESSLKKAVPPSATKEFRGLYMGALDLVYNQLPNVPPDQLQRSVYKVCASRY